MKPMVLKTSMAALLVLAGVGTASVASRAGQPPIHGGDWVSPSPAAWPAASSGRNPS